MSDGSSPANRRRRPRQSRSRVTVDAIVEAAARVFRREGRGATTNRIAEEAGVGIGSLYEYFPNKEALLVELAERHVRLAEDRIGRALDADLDPAGRIAAVQAAIVESHRFPSLAVELVRDVESVGPDLQDRVARLENVTIEALTSLAEQAGHDDATVRGIAAFELIGLLTARAAYLHPEHAESFAAHYRAMTIDLVSGHR